MAFKGRDIVRTKIVIDNKIIEQINLFNYLGNICYEKEVDIDNKLGNYLKITGILNNVFRTQKPLRNKNKIIQSTGPPSSAIWQRKWDCYSKGRQKNNSSRDEIHEKNSRIHLDRLQNKYTNCKGVKNNTNFGQITGIQEKLDTTCK